MVVVLVLAEPQDFTVLVEVCDGGALTAWPCPAGAAGFPSSLLGPRCSCRLAPQHRARPLPLLQVHMHYVFLYLVSAACKLHILMLIFTHFSVLLSTCDPFSKLFTQLSAWHSRKFHIQTELKLPKHFCFKSIHSSITHSKDCYQTNSLCRS